jgi:glycosyltransferase involved in cell wall biosynthesis
MTPRVSVISTVYNGEPYFDRAVPGILNQSFQDFEFIVVDDGSTDQTLPKLRELASRDSRVRVLAPGRLGAAAAFNYGVRQSSGEYIARQDFDDRSYPERLRLQVDFLDANPKVGLVGGYCVLVDERRGERYIRMPPVEHDAILPAMAKYVPIPHTLATFRRRAWSDAEGYPDASNLIDLRFYIRVAKVGWRFANIAEVLGEHYVYETSFFHRTQTYGTRQRDLARVQAQAIRDLRLPRWMYVYAFGRYAYPYLPTGWKRLLRRSLGRSKEQDI